LEAKNNSAFLNNGDLEVNFLITGSRNLTSTYFILEIKGIN